MGYSIAIPQLVVTPITSGKSFPAGGVVVGVFRLPNDPIGVATVTFFGVVATSEIRVYLPDGTEQAGVESCDADHVLTWDVYAAGSANNTVTIRIIHPDYKIKEFTYTSVLGNQSIPVQMERDKWYSNP